MKTSDFTQLISMPQTELYAAANTLRQKASGNKVEVCAIVNVRSGGCGMDCKFCSQSSHHAATAPAYGMIGVENLVARIMALANEPLAHIGLVASGGSLGKAEVQIICAAMSSLPGAIRKRICVSGGRLSLDSMLALQQAGIGRLHHNLETCSSFYPHICTTQSWAQRAETVKRALEVGFAVCCGGIFGVGESWRERIEFALELAAIGVENVPLNFLHPQKGTPLAESPFMEADEAFRVIAIFRHIMPKAVLRVCGGRMPTFRKRQAEVFCAGANALMTGNFLTTMGQAIAEDRKMLAHAGMVNTAEAIF